MQKFLILLFFFIHFCFANHWELIWEDEFNGTSLNKTNWKQEVDCWGGGNNELQCFTTKPNNLKVQGGNLIITAIPEIYTGTANDCTNNMGNTCTATRNYTSARIRSRAESGLSWLYGRWEVRAKLPSGKHLWPAFWMLPTDEIYGSWAASGEIDIMEYRGQVPNKVEGTLHFGGSAPNNIFQGSGPVTFPVDFSQDFHIFAVEWVKDEVRWFVDGKKYYNMTLNRSFFSGRGVNPYTADGQPFDQRMHFIINLSVGGGFFPPNVYGTLTTAEARAWSNPNLVIDYIKAYAKLPFNPPPEEKNNNGFIAGIAILVVLLVLSLVGVIILAVFLIRAKRMGGSAPSAPSSPPQNVPISTYDAYKVPSPSSLQGTTYPNPLNRQYS